MLLNNESQRGEVSKVKFNTLLPVDNADLGVYSEALDFAMKQKDVCNIAISGNYGSGKTSLIRSYANRHKEYKFLYVSVADFNDKDLKTKALSENHSEVSNGTSDQGGDGNASQEDLKANSDSGMWDSTLERKIFNQVIHQVQMDFGSKIKYRIMKQPKKSDHLLSAFCVTLVAYVLFILLNPRTIEYIKEIIWGISNVTMATAYALSLIFVALCFFVCLLPIKGAIGFLGNAGVVHKFRFLDNEIEFKDNENTSFFDEHLDEVIYVFNNCNYTNFVFEDMDRFDSCLIFQRLHEVNALLNAKRKAEGRKPIKFFYLIRDELFTAKLRTKFFDFIVPVVPVVSSSNSFEALKKLLRQSNALDGLNDDFLKAVSIYVDDMRLLKNVVNEYLIYRMTIATTNQDSNKLFAMVLYKNILPYDFSALHLKKGFVYNVMHSKEKVVESIAKSYEYDNEEDYDSDKKFMLTEKLTNLYKRLPGYDFFDNHHLNLDSKYFDYIKKTSYFDFVKFLIRNGYIDESYSDYMSYFYEGDISINDKNFIRSVHDERPSGFDYELDNPSKVIGYLGSAQFESPSVLNFDLVGKLPETTNGEGHMYHLMVQLHNCKRFDFISEYLNQNRPHKEFIRFLSRYWPNVVLECLDDEEKQSTFLDKIVGPLLFESSSKEFICFDVENCLLNYLNDNPSILNFSDSELDNAVSNLVAINVLIRDVEPIDFPIFIDVVKNHLYVPTYRNLVCINERLSCNGEMITNSEESPLSTDCLLTGLLMNAGPVKEFYEREPDWFIDTLLETDQKFKELSDDDCSNVLVYLLNDECLINCLKQKLIQRVATNILFIRSVVDKELWSQLLSADLVKCSIENILAYYAYKKTFDDILVTYLNRSQYKEPIKQSDFDNLELEDEETFISGYMVKLTSCNKLNYMSYKCLASLEGWTLTNFNARGIDDNKISFLIDSRILKMNESNYVFIEEEYPSHLIPFIEANEHEFKDTLLSHATDNEELIERILLSSVGFDVKSALIEQSSVPISSQNPSFSDEIVGCILDFSYSKDDIDYLVSNYEKFNKPVQKKIVDKLKSQLTIHAFEEGFPYRLKINRYLMDSLLRGSALSPSEKMVLLVLNIKKMSRCQCEEYARLIPNWKLVALLNGSGALCPKNLMFEAMLKELKRYHWIHDYEESSDGYKVSKMK